MTQVGLDFIARNRAQRGMQSFSRSITQTSRRLRRFAGAALALAGVGGFGYMIKRQMETIDSLAKLSDRLDMSTESLVGLQHAASISGVEQETLNKSLEIFSRRLGEVRMGVGQAEYALDALGLSADELVDKSPSEAMGVIADQINNLETAADKAAAANYLFGRSGQQLLNMFEQGSIGLREFQKEAEKLGLTFSRFDASQVEAANDALTRARSVLTGLFRQVTIEFAPYIEALANAFTDAATSGEGMRPRVVEVFRDISLAIWKVGKGMSELPIYWVAFQAGAHASIASLYALEDATMNLDRVFKALKIPGWEWTYKEWQEYHEQRAAELLKSGARDLAGLIEQESAIEKFFDDLLRRGAEPVTKSNLELVMERLRALPRGTAEDQAKEQAAVDDAMLAHRIEMLKEGGTLAAMEYRKDIEAIEQQMLIRKQLEDRQMQDFVDKTRSTLEAVRFMHELTRNEKIQYLREYLAEHEAMLTTVVDAERLVNDEIVRYQRERVDGLVAYYEKLKEDIQDVSKAYADLARSIEGSMSNAFYSMIAEGATFSDAMKGFAQDIGRAFSRMLADIAARQVMYGFMTAFGFGAGAGASAGGGGGGSIYTSPHGGPSAQYGGEVIKTGWAQIHRGETFSGVNNEYGGAGASVVVNINNQSGVPLKQQGPPRFDGREYIIDVVAENYDGGGVVADMVQGRRG